MKATVFLLSVLVALYAGSGLAQDDAADKPKPKPDTTVTVSSTHLPTPTATTRTVPSTSKTSELPTTSGPTSPAETTIHTTPKPVPTDIYAVKHKNGSYCILLQANISVVLNYTSTIDNKTATYTVNVPPPPHTVVTGKCDSSNKQSINITFYQSSWVLELTFHKEANNSKYYQSSMHLAWDFSTANVTGAPNISGTVSSDKNMFETSKTGYVCLAKKTLYSNSSENGVTSVMTEKLKLEAFQATPDAKFSDNYDRCSEDNISNLVPIIVGACLGGLILIVLIAYLIGRKRSRRGYESV